MELENFQQIESLLAITWAVEGIRSSETEHNSLEDLSSCLELEDLNSVIDTREVDALVVETFGRRIAKLLQETLVQLCGQIDDMGSAGAAADQQLHPIDNMGGAGVIVHPDGTKINLIQAGNISDTIVYGLSIPLASFPPAVCAIAMLILQTLLNFFVPSGSGQAAVSMPIMAPLADMLGVTRNTAVLAYQFGDGFSNIVWPTAFAAVMSGLAKVKLEKWWKFIMPVFGITLVVQAILLIIAVMTNFGA